MLYLISTIPNGYALREFYGIKYCLDQVDENFCKVVDPSSFRKKDVRVNHKDFYIISDYYFNPTFKEDAISKSLHSLIKSLPKERVAIYYSDPLFKFEDPTKFENWKYFVFFSLANYRKTTTKEYEDCRIWENVDINDKKVLDIPISELAFWSYIKMNGGSTTFEQAKKDYDISYIINSKVKSRMRLLKYLDGSKCQLGNWPAIDNDEIKWFVKKNPECQWVDQKAFGLSYLSMQNGKFTLVMDDDKPIKVAWPMRFYECMCIGILPILDESKECSFIYKDFDYLSALVVDNGRRLRGSIIYNSEPRRYNSLQIDARKFMQKYVYDANRLYKKTLEALQNV